MNRRSFLCGLAAPLLVPAAALSMTNTKLIRPRAFTIPLPHGIYTGDTILIQMRSQGQHWECIKLITDTNDYLTELDFKHA